LIIPGYNDSQDQLRGIADFLAGVSTDIPWHVSAFHPTYKLKEAPPTGATALRWGVEIGREAGLKYIYTGNIPGESENTRCPHCDRELVERLGYRVMRNSVVNGRCPQCGTTIPGVWS